MPSKDNVYTIFDKIADFFRDMPPWLEEVIKGVGRIVLTLLKGAGENYLKQIEDKILETANLYPDATGEEKFAIVWDFAHTLLPAWKESKLDAVIQNLFIWLKEKGRV